MECDIFPVPLTRHEILELPVSRGVRFALTPRYPLKPLRGEAESLVPSSLVPASPPSSLLQYVKLTAARVTPGGKTTGRFGLKA
jgi:hypothetical protein